MQGLYTRLEWLTRAPQDFPDRVKALGSASGPLGWNVQALAQSALDVNQLRKLAAVIERLRARPGALEPFVPFRLALLSNSTADLLVPALIASAARYGIALEVIQPAYNQIAQQALTAESTVAQSRPDAVLLALDYRALPLQCTPGVEPQSAAATVERAVSYLRQLAAGIKVHSDALCIFQNFAPPVETLFGSFDRVHSGTTRNLIDGVNREVAKFVVEGQGVLLDVAALAETVGLADWHDARLWNLAKMPFSAAVMPLYCEHVARIIAALRGKSRRVLVMDLDNTLWGGVIGDDGVEGIRLSQGDAIGEAHLALQRLALDLRRRGVVLAVSSKNTDEVARTPFLRHPDMLLKLEHIAVFEANWFDKAAHMEAIARALSLGLDALVLVDDNPVEREWVRRKLPQVAVPELPGDPALYVRTLTAAGYFEAVAFSAEDRSRAEYYQGNAQRATLQRESEGLDDYLASLQMTFTFAPFDAISRTRIVQLINKSNQYNLTTRRYTEAEVAAMECNPEMWTLQVRVADVFGDNGMVSVVICRRAAEGVWDIDSWLMSCRVLGRRVENRVLEAVVEHARGAGVGKLTGTYLPTERNTLVVDHYRKLGFTQTGGGGDGSTRWELVLGTAVEAAPTFSREGP